MAHHFGECSACAEEYLALRSVAPRPVFAAPPALSWPLSVAALLILSIGMSAVAWSLLQRNRELRAAAMQPALRPVSVPTPSIAPPPEAKPLPPQPNVAVIDLLPVTAVVRGTASEKSPAAPKDGDVTLILNLEPGIPRFGDYSLEIVGSGGAILWKAAGLRRSLHDTFTLHLDRSFFPPGSYELRLYGVRGEQRTPIERYALDLQTASK